MKIKLISNWKQVLKKALSVKANILSAIFIGLEFVLPYLPEYFPYIPDKLFLIFGFLTIITSNILRIIAQEELHDDK